MPTVKCNCGWTGQSDDREQVGIDHINHVLDEHDNLDSEEIENHEQRLRTLKQKQTDNWRTVPETAKRVQELHDRDSVGSILETPLERETQLDRIEKKLDRLLEVLEVVDI